MGQEGKGIYWDLIEMLYEQGGYLMLSECESYAFALRTDKIKLQQVISDFDLFEQKDATFYSNSVLERLGMMKDKSEKASKSAQIRWNNANAMPTQSEGNAIKEKKVNKINEKNIFNKPTQDELKDYFTERGITTPEHERFFDFYESKNWFVGKNKMKDWKAAVRNWIRGMNIKPPKYYTLINGKEVDVEPYQNYFNTETHPEDYAGKTAIGGVAMKKDIKQR